MRTDITNTKAELCVIGSVLLDPDPEHKAIVQVVDYLKPEHFVHPEYKRLYAAMVNQYSQHKRVEPSLLFAHAKVDSKQYVDIVRECNEITLIPSLIRQYADKVIQARNNQEFIKAISKANNRLRDNKAQVKDIRSDLLQDIDNLNNVNWQPSKRIADVVSENKDLYFNETHLQNRTYTNFSKLDSLLNGLEGGDIITIGARPSVGKSAFGLNIAYNVAKQGKTVIYYNLEMTDKQVYERLLALASGIPLKRIKTARDFRGNEKTQFEQGNERLQNLPLIIHSGAKTVSQIRNTSAYEVDVSLIIIDYLQLVRSEKTYGNRASEVGQISKDIKALAMELRVPILQLSQLNRESEKTADREPSMAELREAGDIEQDSSVVILLWRINQEDNSRVGIKIAKNRQGELGSYVMQFNGSFMRFNETNMKISQARQKDDLLSCVESYEVAE